MIEPEATITSPVSGTTRSVYVVDDEPMLLELASVILEPLGHQISIFRDPEAALKAFAQAHPRPDLVITDYAMHSINGMELIQECRRIEPNQRILLLSGTVGIEVFHEAPCQPDRFLAKPYHARQLIDVVRAMLSS